MQLAELREYAARRGWEVYAEYVDSGVSGSKESRPELNRLMADAHRRHFDVVLCWKVDRFGRSLKHLVNSLADLDSYGIAFVSLRDNLDLSTPSGRLMFQIIGAMGQRSSIAFMISSAHRTASAIALMVAGTLFPPSNCASLRAARILAAINSTRLRPSSMQGMVSDSPFVRLWLKVNRHRCEITGVKSRAGLLSH